MKYYFAAALVLLCSLSVFSNSPADSLVRFSELSFSTKFEKQAFENCRQENELNLCLASDKNMTDEKAFTFIAGFGKIVKQLENENLNAKNIRQKYKKTHKIIFCKSPMQYFDNAEFSDILNNGYFNYVTSSAFYSLALKGQNIPSHYLFTQNKTDIIINPDADQIILETQNQKDENGYFNSTDSKGYIVNLLDKNIRIGSEYKYNSSAGNSVIRFKDTDVLKNNQLAATIYFYKAAQQLAAQQTDEAYRLISKACYLFPNETFTKSMYVILSKRLESCKFEKVEDVDLLGQISKFRENNFDYIKRVFHDVIGKGIGKKDLKFCTDAYNRLLPQINDVSLADEISYTYYLGSAYCLRNEKLNLEPALQALKLKPNDKDALSLIESNLRSVVSLTEDKKSLIDTLDRYEIDMNNSDAAVLVNNTKLLLYLKVAKLFFMQNKINEGLQYISRFEAVFKLPLPNLDFKIAIENTYYEYARYYMRFNNRAMAQKIVNKGCGFIPSSNMIESATYAMPVTKPMIIHSKMSKADYEKKMNVKVY